MLGIQDCPCLTQSMIFQLFVTVHQVFEAEGSKRELVLTIVESGHMLVSLGQELLVSRPGYI